MMVQTNWLQSPSLMAKIDHDAQTVSTVCQAEDEAKVRVALQEILDANPGYTPVLIVEDASGEEKTYTSLSSRRTRRQSSATEEPAEEEETTTSE
jgi:hypothetical protein